MNDGLKTPSKKKIKVHAEKCPACNGFGTVGYAKKECHGCRDPVTGKGRGWIAVPDEVPKKNG